jgi:hypothetical protein
VDEAQPVLGIPQRAGEIAHRLEAELHTEAARLAEVG